MDALIDAVINSLASLAPLTPAGASLSAFNDRTHTEEREDNAVQRLVADYRKAGLNPYTIPAGSGASSSASTLGAQQREASLQLLGSLLDVANLSIKNRNSINNTIGKLLK